MTTSRQISAKDTGGSGLPNWLSKITQSGVSGYNSKTVVFWGDSTTSNATTMFGSASQPTVSGGEFGGFYQQAGEVLAGTTLLNYGNNGSFLATALADGVTYGISAVIAAAPDLVVMCWGINDVRTGATNLSQMITLLQQAITRIRSALPNTDIVLWGPNAFLADDPTSSGLVSPLGSAQAYSTLLYQAYAALANVYPNVVVVQKQDALGLTCQLSAVAGPGNAAGWMTDILHPNSAGQVQEALQIAGVIGYRAPFNIEQATVARASNPSAPYSVYAREVEDTSAYALIATGRWQNQGSGFLDFSWPGTLCGQILPGDLIQFGYGNTPFILPFGSTIAPNGAYTRISGMGGSNPPTTITGGTVNIWRSNYAADAIVKQYIQNTIAYPYRRKCLVSSLGNGFLRVSNPADQPAMQSYRFKSTDVVVVPGAAAITAPSATGWNAANVYQFGNTGNLTGNTAKYAWIFGTQFERFAIETTFDPIHVDLVGSLSNATIKKYAQKGGVIDSASGFLGTAGSSQSTLVIAVNGSTVVTLTWAISGTSPSVSWASGSSFSLHSGDTITATFTAGTGAADLSVALDAA